MRFGLNDGKNVFLKKGCGLITSGLLPGRKFSIYIIEGIGSLGIIVLKFKMPFSEGEYSVYNGGKMKGKRALQIFRLYQVHIQEE